jgi:predicted ATPase
MAHDVGERLLSLAQAIQDPALLLQAHRTQGITLRFLGELASARAHLKEGIALYDRQQHHSLVFLYGGPDPKVACLTYATLILWTLGYPDQALQSSQEALALSQELSHPLSLAYALYMAACLHQFRREGSAVQERAEATITLSTEQGLPLFLAQGTLLLGWALVNRGRGAEGIVLIRKALTAYQASGAELLRPYFLALLAETYGNGGQAEEGLSALAEALAAMHRTGERWGEAELYRLKGELLLACSPEHDAEAESCFRQALDVARR